MKTWKDYAMQVCEERDIECRDEDDLREVFLDYCDPIELIQKLQKEIDELKKENEKLKQELYEWEKYEN